MKAKLADYQARDCQVTLDGEDYSGRYLFVEVMNIRSIGPNVELAPKADPGDGSFDVVFLPEKDREALADYLNNTLKGEAARLTLAVRKAQHVTLSSADELKLHVDDELVSINHSASFHIRLKPGMLAFV